MEERVEIFAVDEEGILLRSYIEEEYYLFEGEIDDPLSPLMAALGTYYLEEAPETMMCLGFDTPHGELIWQTEFATPYGDENYVELGERLFLVDRDDQRIYDELAYETLSVGKIPEGWILISRENVCHEAD